MSEEIPVVPAPEPEVPAINPALNTSGKLVTPETLELEQILPGSIKLSSKPAQTALVKAYAAKLRPELTRVGKSVYAKLESAADKAVRAAIIEAIKTSDTKGNSVK